jgi:PilZ domain-containing protein
MQEANYKNRSDAADALRRGINKPLLNERRGSRRLALSLPVEVCGESPFNPQTFCGRTRDVASTGLYFFCEEAYMVGQLVHVTIKLSGDLVAGSDRVSLKLRYRVQRFEEMIRNGSKTFGVAVALDE